MSVTKPALDNEGEVYIYLQPFPQEAYSLTVEIESIEALRNDGTKFPLFISIPTLKGKEMKRQLLFARGQLPPGVYSSLLIKAKTAKIASPEGEVALLVPLEAPKSQFIFEILARRAVVLTLRLKISDAMPDDFSFNPIFDISIPSKTLSDLTGYASNRADNTITVFDKKNGVVTGFISTPERPMGIALDQVSRRAYIVFEDADSVGVLDVLSGSIIKVITLNYGDRPREVALTPDRKLLLVVNGRSQTVSFVSTDNLFEMSRVNVKEGPHSILIDGLGNKAYVFNSLSNSISVINIQARAVVANVTVDPGPIMGQFNRKGDRMYVISNRSPYMIVLNPVSMAILSRPFIGIGARTIKVDHQTDFIYLGRSMGPDIDIYDPFTLVAGDFIKSGGGISSMTIDSQENNLCFLIPDKRLLRIVNLTSRKIISEIDVGEDPYWVTVMGEQ